MLALVQEFGEELDLGLAAEVGAEMYRLISSYSKDPDVLEEIRTFANELKIAVAHGRALHLVEVQNLTVKQLAVIHLQHMWKDSDLDRAVTENLTVRERLVAFVAIRRYRRTLTKIRLITEQLS